MKRNILKTLVLAAFVTLLPVALSAQTSKSLLGPNGIGWNPGPMIQPQNQPQTPANQIPVNQIPVNPAPENPGTWIPGFWNPSQSNAPMPNTPIVASPQLVTGISNQGITKVVACGYDNEGIWRVLPLTVSYQYDGFQYNVNVLNAWNPWTNQWDRGVDEPAFNTFYLLRGIEYNFYTVLSTGTYYFNL